MKPCLYGIKNSNRDFSNADAWGKNQFNSSFPASFNLKNDKAFASSGNITNRFMLSENLILPRIKKSEIRNIILGGGQNLLSPERRFDAIIYNSSELFYEMC